MANADGGNNGFDLQSRQPIVTDYIQIILRGKWIILACLALGFGVSEFVTMRTMSVYEATATVLLDSKGQERVVPLYFTGMSSTNKIRNEIEVLRSRGIAELVAKRLIEKRFIDDQRTQLIRIIRASSEGVMLDSVDAAGRIIGRVQGSVSFEPVSESDILKIVGKSNDPREAALIANVYAQVYQDRNLEMSRVRTKAVGDFLRAQLEAKKETLAESEDSLQTYMEKTGIVSLDQEASQVIGQLSKLEAERDAADIQIKSLSSTLQSYKDQLAIQEPHVAKMIGEANDPYIRMLQDQIAKLEVQKDVTVAQNPAVSGQELYTQKLKEIDDQISALRKKLAVRTDEFLRSLLPGSSATAQGSGAATYLGAVKEKIIEIQIEKQSLEAKIKALTSVINDYEKQFNDIPGRSIQLARLQRNRLSNEKLYLMLEEKFNDAVISEQSEFGYVDIIDPAMVPSGPVSPKAQTNLFLGSLVGLMLGIALTFVRDYFDLRIKSPEDLKNRGYQMVFTVAKMDTELRSLGQNLISKVSGKELDPHLITVTNPLASISESFRRVRTAIQYAQLDNPPRAILVTSPNPSEGKSTIVANLAVVFAQAGKKVLLLDTDLRKSNLHREFDLKQEPGLIDYLFGEASEEQVIQRAGVDNLDIITSGKIPPNPAEVLGSQKMKDAVTRLKASYDLLLFDSGPVLAVADAVLLSTIADGTIVITYAGKTRFDELEQTLDALSSVGSKNLGIVLNYFDPRKAYGGYAHRYKYSSYHYHYGQGGDGQRGVKTADQKGGA